MARIRSGEAALVEPLLYDYLREFARGEGAELSTDDDGPPLYPWFAAYWRDPQRVPIGFWLADQLVGFSLLRDDGEAWQIAEFYVAPSHRRQGIGDIALLRIVRMCQTFGGHGELRAKVHHWNHRAAKFWRAHGFEPRLEDAEGVVMAIPLVRPE